MNRSPSEASASTDRADRVADRLAVPVLIAALASVPAVFLTLFDDPWERLGTGINTVSGAVLVLETVVLLALAEDRRAWLRRNRWLVGLTVAVVPAVLFAIGPVQLLRLARVVRVAGALRIIRVGRILKAGRIVRERTGLDQGWQRAIGVGATLLCAAFVVIVLADDTSTSRRAVDGVLATVGLPGVVVAGLLLGAATYLVRTDRVGSRDRSEDADAASAGAHRVTPDAHQAGDGGG